MQTTSWDYLLCGSTLTLLTAMALGLTLFGAAPHTSALLGNYHVVADCLLFLVSYGIMSGLAVRLLMVVRPLSSGVYPMHARTFAYWKLLMMITDFGRRALVPVTPLFLRPKIAWLFGAKVGKNVALGGTMVDPFMVELGNNVIVGDGAQLCGNYTQEQSITLGRVLISDGATVGINAIVFPGVEIGKRAVVAINSVVMPGTKIPAGETWRGNPARKWQ